MLEFFKKRSGWRDDADKCSVCGELEEKKSVIQINAMRTTMLLSRVSMKWNFCMSD